MPFPLQESVEPQPRQSLFLPPLTLSDPSTYLSTALARIRDIILFHGRIWVDGRRLHGVDVRAALEQQPSGVLPMIALLTPG